MTAVRKVLAADVPQFAAVLARAFYNDPPAKWFFPNDKLREPRLRQWFSLALRRLYLRHGECYATEELAGAAIGVPPGAHEGLLDQLALLPAAVALFRRDLVRALRALKQATHPTERHYLLAISWGSPPSGKAGASARHSSDRYSSAAIEYVWRLTWRRQRLTTEPSTSGMVL